MKILNLIPALALSGLMASTAMAAPNVIIGDDTINIGSTASIDLTFQADGVVAGLDFTFSFDDTQFTATPACVSSLPTTGPDATVVCSVVGSTLKVLVSAPFAFPVPTILTGDQPLGAISFQSKVDTPVTGYDLLITEENYFDINASGVTPTQSTNGLITVKAGPQPDYSSNPAPASGIVLNVVQGGSNPSQDVAISNVGEPGSTLTGACTETSDPDGVFTISGDTSFSVDQGAAADVVNVSCDAAATIATHSGTMECTHNGTGATEVDPAVYTLRCDILAGPPAVYDSTPKPNDPIELTTPGNDVPSGTPVGDQVLTIRNIAPEADADLLALSNCAFTGSSAITTVGPGSMLVAQGTSTTVTFSCNSTDVGTYTGTYSCDYDVNNDAVVDGTASYPVHCGVRAAASDLEPSTAPVNIVVPVFGTGQNSVTFTEILDEGVNATVDSCSFADGSNFSVVSTFPVTVTAGSTVTIVVDGTDPADGSISVSDVLTCSYTDSDSTPGTATWEVTLLIQSAAIPTLSSWGLMLMILTMLGLGGIVIRRKTFS